jgi:protein gp37
MNTGISWTTHTWNWATGCTKVDTEGGCRSCYAEHLFKVNRGNVFKHPFEQVTVHPERFMQAHKFKPIKTPEGLLPAMVFTNSISDVWHEQIPDDMIHRMLDIVEQNPRTIFQALSKRPVRGRKILVGRYGNQGIPSNLWVGFSVSRNEVSGVLNILRSIKERTGGNMTAFTSVEPIVGKTDQVNFEGIDWAIFGGESGPHARIMQRDWLMAGIENAQKAGSRVWLKQHGTIRSHPNLDQAPADLGITAKFKWLVENGWEALPQEKGGATVDKTCYRDLPLAYDKLRAKLNDTLL